MLKMYAYYLELWRYEIHILQSKPTELRHLMGRIGELLCVLETSENVAADTLAVVKKLHSKRNATITFFIV